MCYKCFCELLLGYFENSFCVCFKGKPVSNVHTNVGTGGKEAIVNHLMMNSPTLHGGFLSSLLLYALAVETL